MANKYEVIEHTIYCDNKPHIVYTYKKIPLYKRLINKIKRWLYGE